MRKLFSLIAAVLFAGSMMASEAKVTLDFTDAGWNFPSAYTKTAESYTNGGFTVAFSESNNGHKYLTVSQSDLTPTGIIFGKQNASISFPAFDFAVGKILVHYVSAQGGANTVHNIFVGDEAVSAAETGCKVTETKSFSTFEIAANAQAAGTIYVLKVTSAHNMQVSKVEFFEAGEDPQEETVVYDWAGEIGTTLLGTTGVEETKVKIHTNTDEVPAIKFGSSYVYADGKWIAIKPAEGGFKAGDVLSVAVVFNNADDTKYAQVDLRAADRDTRIWLSDSASTINGRTSAAEPIVQTYKLEADQDSLLLGRYGNTGMFITLLKVVRGGEAPEEKLTFDFKLENNILTITPSNNDPWAGASLPTADFNGEYFGGDPAAVAAMFVDMIEAVPGKRSLDLTKLDPEVFPAGTACVFTAWGFVDNAVTTVDTISFVVPAPAQPITCAEVYNLEDKADVVLNDVVVTYVNGVNVWVKDASASMLLYLSAETTWKAGDVLKGVAGQVAIYNDLYEVKPSADQVAAVVVAEGEAPAPEELAEVTAANMNAYILMKGLALEGTFEEGKNGSITIYEGLALFNKFKQAYVFEAGKTYDVLGTVSIYKGSLQVNFISAEALAPTLDKTVLYVAFPSENRPENIEVAGTFEAGKWGMRVFNGDWYTSNEDLYTSGEDTFKFRSSDNNDLILCKYNTGKAIWEQVILKFGDFPITEFKLEMVRLIEELDLSAAADYAWKTGAPEPGTDVEVDTITCAKAAEDALAGETYEAYVKGYVTEIAYAWKNGSMSFWMADTKDGGKVFEAYKCAIEKEEDAVRVGDLVKAHGTLTKYNTTPELAEGCTVEILERAPEVVPQNLGEKTIAEFLELKNKIDTCILTGAIDSVVNTLFGNFYLKDATATVYVYGLLNAAGEAKKCFEEEGLQVGDIITIKAIYSEYSNNPQVKNAIFVSKKGQGIDNTSVEITVEKFFRDGQLIIRKNGIEYNVQGAVIK